MEFSYNPINPFQDDGLSKEDRAMIDGMRNTAYVCGYRGEDVEFAVHKSLKRMGGNDLLPPCEQEKQQIKYCDRNICLQNEYNNIGCEDCVVTKGEQK